MVSISVIICTLNRSDLILKYQLGHLKLLGAEDDMIIVDASDDDATERIVKSDEFNNHVKQIKYIRSLPNLPAQRNLGISNSEKDIILFLDDDISLASHSIASIRKIFTDHSEVSGTTGRLIEKNPPNTAHKLLENVLSRIFGISCFGLSRLQQSGLPAIPEGNIPDHDAEFMRGGFSAYRRQVFENDCSFNEKFSGYAYLEDTDFSHQLKINCQRLVYSSLWTGFHEHVSATRKNHERERCLYVLNYAEISRRFNIKKTNFLRAIIGLLFLNLLKSLMTRNFSYFKGTATGVLKCFLA